MEKTAEMGEGSVNRVEWNVDVVVPFGPTTATRPGSLSVVLETLGQLRSLERLVVVANGVERSKAEDELALAPGVIPKVDLVHVERANLAAARNVGAGRGSADYLLFCDADTLPGPETVQNLPWLASQDSFCMGALRRFIPLSMNIDEIRCAAVAGDWAYLDDVATAQPAYATDDSYAQVKPPLVARYTFLGSFGLVPRVLFETVNGFDERYEGWGLEDVDLIRKLVQKARCKLMKGSRVWHIDHFVEPFRSANHWLKNWETYVRGVEEHGLLLPNELLSGEIWPVNPRGAWLRPRKRRISHKRINTLPLLGEYKEVLAVCVDRRVGDRRVAGVLLYGSARCKEEPHDIDILTLVLGKDVHSHTCEGHGEIVVEDKRLSLLDLRQRVGQPGRNPDTWMCVLSRFDSAWILGQRLALGSYLDKIRRAAIRRHAYHLLTYHLGNLAKGGRTESHGRWNSGLHIACIVGLAGNECPDMIRPPYFSNALLADQVKEPLGAFVDNDEEWLRVSLEKTVEKIIRTFGLGKGFQMALYPASERGYGLLKDWGIAVAVPRWETEAYGRG